MLTLPDWFKGKKNSFGKKKLLPEGQNYLTSVMTKDIFFPCVCKFAQVESRNVAAEYFEARQWPWPLGESGG